MKTAFANGDFEKWIELWDEKVQGLGHWNDEGRAAVLKAFHEHGHIAANENLYNHLKDNPRYIKLLKEMNLSID